MATILDYLEHRADIVRRSLPNVFIVCPGCGTRKAKCAVHIRRGIGNCFRASCSLNGGFSFVRLITELEHVSFAEAISIAQDYRDETERDFTAQRYGTNRDYPRNAMFLGDMVQVLEKKTQDLLKHAVEYLVRKRNLTDRQMSDYLLGVGMEDFEQEGKLIPRYGMIVIPILLNGEIVSYCERSIEIAGGIIGRQKHYKAEPAEGYLPPSATLFNCDRAIPEARIRGFLPLFEDAWSAIKLDGVATLGPDISDEQLYILANNWRGTVVVCRDNDPGGWAAERKDVKLLSRYFSDVRIVRPVGIDPDDNLEATRGLIENAPKLDRLAFDIGL